MTSLVIFNLTILLFSPSIVFVRATIMEDFTLNYRLYTKEEQIFIMGEVINNKNEPVREVQVRIDFLNSTQAIIKTFNTYAWLGVILPGRRAPFLGNIDASTVEGYVECKVEITTYKISEGKPFGLLIPSASLWPLEDGCMVKGEVMNDGNETIDSFIVVACFYDDKGFLAAAASEPISLEEKMQPLEREEFVLFSEFVNESTSLKKYMLVAESPNYIINNEVWIIIPKLSNQIYDYRLLIPISVLIVLIVTVIITVRKQKRGSQRIRKMRKHQPARFKAAQGKGKPKISKNKFFKAKL